MLFNPFNFDRKIIISFGLIFPRITVLFFVIANILLPSIAAFIYNAKVTTMQYTRVGSILYFYGENTSGIFGVIISENRISIRISDLIETFVKNVSYFFGIFSINSSAQAARQHIERLVARLIREAG